jgi:hypothetical protein
MREAAGLASVRLVPAPDDREAADGRRIDARFARGDAGAVVSKVGLSAVVRCERVPNLDRDACFPAGGAATGRARRVGVRESREYNHKQQFIDEVLTPFGARVHSSIHRRPRPRQRVHLARHEEMHREISTLFTRERLGRAYGDTWLSCWSGGPTPMTSTRGRWRGWISRLGILPVRFRRAEPRFAFQALDRSLLRR